MLTGTVFPLLVEALQDKQITVGEPYFARLGVPIGIALLFLMAVGPALPWRAASGELLRNRLLIPAWVGALTLVVARARRRARHRQRARVRARRVRAREHRPLGGRRRARPAGARPREALPVARRAHGARATRGCTAGCSCTSASS